MQYWKFMNRLFLFVPVEWQRCWWDAQTVPSRGNCYAKLRAILLYCISSCNSTKTWQFFTEFLPKISRGIIGRNTKLSTDLFILQVLIISVPHSFSRASFFASTRQKRKLGVCGYGQTDRHNKGNTTIVHCSPMKRYACGVRVPNGAECFTFCLSVKLSADPPVALSRAFRSCQDLQSVFASLAKIVGGCLSAPSCVSRKCFSSCMGCSGRRQLHCSSLSFIMTNMNLALSLV